MTKSEADLKPANGGQFTPVIFKFSIPMCNIVMFLKCYGYSEIDPHIYFLCS
jgi:hypothetical protein